MATSLQVTCIVKPDRTNRRERIQYIGGPNPNAATMWRLSEDDAIRGIENGTYAFYVNAGGQIAHVIVATHNGNKYLKTTADTTTKDNLLSLPECR